MRLQVLCFVLALAGWLVPAAKADAIFTPLLGTVDVKYYPADSLNPFQTGGAAVGTISSPSATDYGWSLGTGQAPLVMTNWAGDQSIFLLFDFAGSTTGDPWNVAGYGANNGATDPSLLQFVKPLVGTFTFNGFGSDAGGDYADFDLAQVRAVPEPGILALLLVGGLGIAGRRRFLA